MNPNDQLNNSHSSKADSLRAYLQGLVSPEQFEQAYTRVVQAGVEAMEVDLQDVFADTEAAERLLPLFQLLIFLEELALETEDYPQRPFDSGPGASPRDYPAAGGSGGQY